MSIMRFFSPAGGEIFMIRSHGQKVFEGSQCFLAAKGAISPEDLSQAIEQLEKTIRILEETKIKKQNENNENNENEQTSSEKENKVSFSTRFYPLLSLMKKARKQEKLLHWETL